MPISQSKNTLILHKGVLSIRRGTSLQWAEKDPILALHEPGLDLDENNFKIGDGVKPWSQLPWIGNADVHRLASINDIQISASGELTVTINEAPTQSYDVVIVYKTRNGTATAGVDYLAKQGYLTFKQGETSKTITVDSLPGGQGTFYVDLTDLGGALALKAEGLVTLGIPDISISDGVLDSVLISISDGLLDSVQLSISDGVLSNPNLVVSPTSLSFVQDVNTDSDPQVVTLRNDSGSQIEISDIQVTDEWSYTTTCSSVLDDGNSCTVSVVFSPTEPGSKSGVLSIGTNVGSNSVSLSGLGISNELTPLSTSGSMFVDSFDTPVRLKSVNWFGAEGLNYTPHGTWARNYRDIIDQIQSMGFNCIRIPFSGDFTTPGRQVSPTAIDYASNPDLVGLNAIEVMDKIIDYCLSQNIYVVLDHHRREAGAGADGSPISATYTLQDWKDSWAVMANRYKDRVNVIGADLHNEPHDLTWDVWASYAEEVGDYIHTITQDWIIFVEGVGNIDSDFYWWGGQLAGVRDRPVELTVSNKLAYSPHEYGQSVGSQTWLAYDGQPPPSNWPNNLYQVWLNHWSFIYYENIAPVWIGEFGGHFGVDGNGNTTKPNGVYEGQWVTELGKHVNGSIDGSSTVSGSGNGISFAYWSFNPNSADTGGLVMDDWITPQTVKLDLIAPMFTNPEPPTFDTRITTDEDVRVTTDGDIRIV